MKKEHNVEIEWIHFPLHPETPAEGQSLEEMFAGRGYDIEAAQKRLSGLMEQEGLPYANRTMTYNSRMAQEIGKWADSKGEGDKLHDAMFRAFFVDLIDISDHDEILNIVESVGLPVEEAREVMEQRTFKQQVDQDWSLSMQMGVTGVPTFVGGGYKVVGAQPYEALTQLADAIKASPAGDDSEGQAQ